MVDRHDPPAAPSEMIAQSHRTVDGQGVGSAIQGSGGGGPSADSRAGDPDSRIRTHLANERTFLAWLRTGLSLIIVGLGVAQFVPRELVPGLPLTTMFACLLVVAGSALTVLAGAQYRRSRDAIDRGTYRAAGLTVGIAVVVVGLAGVLTLVLVLQLRRAGF